MEQTVLRRAPYRNYFARLGRFILLTNGCKPASDPLAPFTDGLPSGRSRLLFCHLDIVKCATKKPWSDLTARDKRTLTGNCSPYLEQQIRSSPQLRLIFINGRTAYNECLPFLSHLSFDGMEQKVPLGSSSTCIASGTLNIARRAVKVVAWTANVVNGHLTARDRKTLAHKVRAALGDRVRS